MLEAEHIFYKELAVELRNIKTNIHESRAIINKAEQILIDIQDTVDKFYNEQIREE